MNKLTKKHDKLAKKFLTDLTIAQEFLIQYLPKDLLVKCDLNSLVIESGSYIEDDLKSQCSDIVYKVNFKNSPKLAYIYVLVEHQSTPEQLMPYRIIKYQLAIIQNHLDKHKAKTKNKNEKIELPLVAPIVFYNGKKTPYPYYSDIRDLFSNKSIYDKILLGKFNLIDLTIKEDDELLRHGKLALLEILIKHIHRRDLRELADVIALAFKIGHDNDLSENLVSGAFSYLILAREKVEIEDIFKKVLDEVPDYEETAMTYAEELLRQGRHEGEQRGKQEGLQQGMLSMQKQIIDKMLNSGVSLAKIAEYVGISLEKLKQICNK